MSLIRKQQQKLAAATAASDKEIVSPGARVLGTMPQGLMGGQQLAAMLDASLEEDLKALHDVASLERKAALKRDVLLPKYREYISRLMAEGKRHDLLGYYVVWAFDAGAIEEALRLAFWCMENGHDLPERFKSPLALFVATQTLAWAEKEFDSGRSHSPYLAAVLAAVEGEQGGQAWDIPDRIKAVFYRLIGLQAEKEENLAAAAENLERAFALGGKVKTALEAVKKRLVRADTDTQPPASAPDAATVTSGDDPGAEKAGG